MSNTSRLSPTIQCWLPPRGLIKSARLKGLADHSIISPPSTVTAVKGTKISKLRGSSVARQRISGANSSQAGVIAAISLAMRRFRADAGAIRSSSGASSAATTICVMFCASDPPMNTAAKASSGKTPVIVKKFPRVVSFPKKIKAVGRKYTSCSSVREISIGSRRIKRHSFCSTTAKKLRWKRMGRVRLPTRTRPPVTLEVAPVKNALWVSCTLPAKVNMPKASINSVGNGSKSAALAGSSSGLSEVRLLRLELIFCNHGRLSLLTKRPSCVIK